MTIDTHLHTSGPQDGDEDLTPSSPPVSHGNRRIIYPSPPPLLSCFQLTLHHYVRVISACTRRNWRKWKVSQSSGTSGTQRKSNKRKSKQGQLVPHTEQSEQRGRVGTHKRRAGAKTDEDDRKRQQTGQKWMCILLMITAAMKRKQEADIRSAHDGHLWAFPAPRYLNSSL